MPDCSHCNRPLKAAHPGPEKCECEAVYFFTAADFPDPPDELVELDKETGQLTRRKKRA